MPSPNIYDPSAIPASAFRVIAWLAPGVLAWALWLLRQAAPGRFARIAAGVLAWALFVGLWGALRPLEHTRLLPLVALPLVLPPAAAILWTALRGSPRFFAGISLPALALLQTFRLPLELFGLHGLYLGGAMPRSMTFEGGNFDIVIGLSAPLVATLLTFDRHLVLRTRRLLLLWNVAGLLTLANVVVRGLFSIPSNLQLWAFDVPNLAVTEFPFVYIPGLFVMAALMGHLFSLRILFARGDSLAVAHQKAPVHSC